MTMSCVGQTTGFAVLRLQDVVGCKHQEARFRLCLDRKRYVNRHLVAVEVRVERGTYERMQLDRATLDEDRLKRLNAPDGAASARG